MKSSNCNFAKNDSEAEAKYKKYKSLDPFPSIPPALLNSADIVNYVAATGMIFPFKETKDRLKPASYRIDVYGKSIYWDAHGEKKEFFLDRDKQITLEPNSIVFVGVEPTFRIPEYIALRFNLQISHVYKGLLVGTGPLVDPGFVGKIWLPLHNLTANHYTLSAHDAIIWMEFTKLSPNSDEVGPNDLHGKCGTFYSFPERKNFNKGIDYYLKKAIEPIQSIRSSIPVAIQKASANAEKAANDAEATRLAVEETSNKVKEGLEKFELYKVSIKSDNEKSEISNSSEIDKVKSQSILIAPIVSGVAALLLVLLTYLSIVYPINNLIYGVTEKNNLVNSRLDKLNEQFSTVDRRIASIENAEKNKAQVAGINDAAGPNPIISAELEQFREQTRKQIDDQVAMVKGNVSALERMFWMATLVVVIVVGGLFVYLWFIYKWLKKDSDLRTERLVTMILKNNENL